MSETRKRFCTARHVAPGTWCIGCNFNPFFFSPRFRGVVGIGVLETWMGARRKTTRHNVELCLVSEVARAWETARRGDVVVRLLVFCAWSVERRDSMSGLGCCFW